MSGKYSDVILAYNPMRSADQRGELLFKVTYEPTGSGLVQRTAGSNTIFDNFFGGKGGWTGAVSETDAKAEITAALQESVYSLDQLHNSDADSDERKAVFTQMQKLANNTDPLARRIGELYNKIYTVTFQGSTPTGGRAPTPVVLSATNSTDWVPADVNQVGVGGTTDRVTVVVNTLITTSPAVAHLEINASGAGGNNHKIGSTTGAVDISADHDNKTLFNWDIVQLLSLPGRTTNDNIFDNIVGTPGIEFERTVRRNSGGELEIEVNGTWTVLSKVRTAPCEAVAASKNCNEIITSCLINDNKDGKPVALQSEQCLDVLQNTGNDLWKATKADVKKMNPKAAFMLLKNLGFKGKKNGNTVVCEQVSDWAERVKTDKLTGDDGKEVKLVDQGATHTVVAIQSYCANTNLVAFLELVVGYVDSNPAILNQGSGFASNPSMDAKDPFGIMRPRGNFKTGSSLDDFRQSATSSLDGVHLHISGIMAALGQNQGGRIMFGGAVVPGYLAPSGTAPLKAKVSRFSTRLREVYDHYVTRLNAMQKDLSQATKDKVNNVFTNLSLKEDELIKWVEYLERYYEVVQMSGNNTKRTITESDLKDAYTKYENNLVKLRKRTVNLIDILATLSNATNDSESTATVLPSSV